MEEKEYEEMYALEDTYWWFQGRKSIIFSLLNKHGLLRNDSRKNIVDLGCGTGLILGELNNIAMTFGVDFSALALTFCRRRGLEHLVCADVNNLPFADTQFDLVFALDLLEHIEDDIHLMSEIYRILRPGGTIMITVPAHKSLWSEHDEALHHFRRYSYRRFLNLITETGFVPRKYTYCISFTFIPIVLFRHIQRLVKPSGKPKTHLIVLPSWINKALIKVLNIEAYLLRYINLPFGISLLCLAKKNKRSL